MKRNLLTACMLFTLTLTGWAGTANAIVLTYDISDTSSATNTSSPTFTSGDTLSFEFLDTTDFNALTNSDLLSWEWIVGGTSYFADDLLFGSSTSVDSFFDVVGSEVQLVVGATGTHDLIRSDAGTTQIGQTSWTSLLVYTGGRGNVISATWGDSVATFSPFNTTSTVPEPSSLLLMGLGLAGLGFMCKRKV